MIIRLDLISASSILSPLAAIANVFCNESASTFAFDSGKAVATTKLSVSTTRASFTSDFFIASAANSRRLTAGFFSCPNTDGEQAKITMEMAKRRGMVGSWRDSWENFGLAVIGDYSGSQAEQIPLAI